MLAAQEPKLQRSDADDLGHRPTDFGFAGAGIEKHLRENVLIQHAVDQKVDGIAVPPLDMSPVS